MITALILLPAVILIVLKGGPFVFASLVAVFTFIGMIEFYRMALPDRKVESGIAAACGALFIFLPFANDKSIIITAIAALFLFFALIFLFNLKEISTAAQEVAYAMLAFLYIPFLLAHLILLRNANFGIEWLFMIMFIVMTNDSAAFYTGSAFGRHKLYPLVSPKKSIEGALGGLVGSLAGTMLAKFTFFPQLTFVDAILTAILIGVTGQIGDLFESLLKRSFGVKDSGTIFPGHGGVLDRLDSIIFAAPITYYYAVYVFGYF